MIEIKGKFGQPVQPPLESVTITVDPMTWAALQKFAGKIGGDRQYSLYISGTSTSPLNGDDRALVRAFCTQVYNATVKP